MARVAALMLVFSLTLALMIGSVVCTFDDAKEQVYDATSDLKDGAKEMYDDVTGAPASSWTEMFKDWFSGGGSADSSFDDAPSPAPMVDDAPTPAPMADDDASSPSPAAADFDLA